MGEAKLKLNDKIEIIDDNIAFRSTVQDVKKDEFLIDVPFSGSKYFLMHIGSSVEFFVSSNRDVIKYRSVVLGKTLENNIQLLILSDPEEIERVQRREFFRLPISMEAGFYALPEKGTYLSIKDVPEGYLKRLEKVYTLDLSGGGLKILSKQNMIIGQRAVISLNVLEEIIFLCSVIRIEAQPETKNYKIAFKFEGAPERVRDKVIKFIFSKLREKSKLLR